MKRKMRGSNSAFIFGRRFIEVIPGGYPVDTVRVELAPQGAHVVHGHILLADMYAKRQTHAIQVLYWFLALGPEKRRSPQSLTASVPRHAALVATIWFLACKQLAPNSSANSASAKWGWKRADRREPVTGTFSYRFFRYLCYFPRRRVRRIAIACSIANRPGDAVVPPSPKLCRRGFFFKMGAGRSSVSGAASVLSLCTISSRMSKGGSGLVAKSTWARTGAPSAFCQMTSAISCEWESLDGNP